MFQSVHSVELEKTKQMSVKSFKSEFKRRSYGQNKLGEKFYVVGDVDKSYMVGDMDKWTA